MSKVKYYYDPETLSYRKIPTKRGRKLRNFLLFITASVFFGLAGLFVLLNVAVVHTPKELSQARELRNYELQFELLNKKMAQIENVLHNIEERDNQIYRMYFEADPIPEEQRRAGFGGVNRYKSLEGFDNSEMI
ncbi:MAG: OST5 family protein, partial [Bacteroidota bacterium]